MKLIIDYKTHKSEHDLVEGNTCCPQCGTGDEVYVETGEGDYYVGPAYYCLYCKVTFTLQFGGEFKDNYKFIKD